MMGARNVTCLGLIKKNILVSNSEGVICFFLFFYIGSVLNILCDLLAPTVNVNVQRTAISTL